MTEISTIGTALITFFGNVISAIFTESGSWHTLLTYLLIGVASSLLFAGVNVIRKVMWGN